MNYDLIENIVDICDKLNAEENVTIFGFGINGDLVLHIYKDSDYRRKINEDNFNLVSICTTQNEKQVDDTEDIYVTDGTLHKELERIWNYKELRTL